ncbi:hypothetical protein HHL28_01730 [Aerophototrophica crusticola]|uniref:DUF2059 domain-containing protein n=1 Tax=Aerophototrophica crusticola TaxID=1709002 RepID=A0A858R474_9PROT|nr:hypothetical protein HHL28_01730 [Rhodospirillaceae bacterium B3]
MRSLIPGLLALSFLATPALAETKPSPEAMAVAARYLAANNLLNLDLQFTAEGIAAAQGKRIPADLDPAVKAKLDAASASLQDIARPAVREALAETLARYVPTPALAEAAAFSETPAGKAAAAVRRAMVLEPELRESALFRPDPELTARLLEEAAAKGLKTPKEFRFPIRDTDD